MSVTAAKGFAASGVAAGIRRKGLDLAVVRSTVPAVGAAMFTVNQVLAARSSSRSSISRRRAAGDRDQLGRRQRATGERGELDALATAAEAGGCSTSTPRSARPLDRRDRRAAAAREGARRPARSRPGLSPDGGPAPPRRS
jgi:N-acetylglutamate synthase/N-acetylornithine aminotransferase